MRKHCIVTVLVLLATACAPGLAESVAAPLPVVQPLPLPVAPPLPLDALPPAALPLPGAHEVALPGDHAVVRHGEDALEVRRAVSNRDNDCRFYRCTNQADESALLRLCSIPGDDRLALQWTRRSPETGALMEGTAHYISRRRALRYLQGRGCFSLSEEETNDRYAYHR